MANLLTETLEALAEAGHSPEEVRWTGSNDGKYAASWKRFARLADREYIPEDDEVHDDLVIVGDGWWLARNWDDSEWEYFQMPKRADKPGKIDRLLVIDITAQMEGRPTREPYDNSQKAVDEWAAEMAAYEISHDPD